MILELTVEDALPGDELLIEEDRKLKVQARVLGDPTFDPPKALEIILHGEVIKKRLAQLTEIEERYKEFYPNHPDHLFVLQWSQLAKRIDEARKIYADLTTLAEKEKALRGRN